MDGMADRFTRFEEFWPCYVAMHSRPLTRWIHLVGTLSGAALTVAGAATGTWWLLPGLPILGYSAAWPAHWFVERNNPASFGYPTWSLRGDVAMIGRMLRGRNHELTSIATAWLAEHPEHRAPGSLQPAGR